MLCVLVFQSAIANASSLAEVERLKGMLQAGQIPGRDLRQGQNQRIFFIYGCFYLSLYGGKHQFVLTVIMSPNITSFVFDLVSTNG